MPRESFSPKPASSPDSSRLKNGVQIAKRKERIKQAPSVADENLDLQKIDQDWDELAAAQEAAAPISETRLKALPKARENFAHEKDNVIISPEAARPDISHVADEVNTYFKQPAALKGYLDSISGQLSSGAKMEELSLPWGSEKFTDIGWKAEDVHQLVAKMHHDNPTLEGAKYVETLREKIAAEEKEKSELAAKQAREYKNLRERAEKIASQIETLREKMSLGERAGNFFRRLGGTKVSDTEVKRTELQNTLDDIRGEMSMYEESEQDKKYKQEPSYVKSKSEAAKDILAETAATLMPGVANIEERNQAATEARQGISLPQEEFTKLEEFEASLERNPATALQQQRDLQKANRDRLKAAAEARRKEAAQDEAIRIGGAGNGARRRGAGVGMASTAEIAARAQRDEMAERPMTDEERQVLSEEFQAQRREDMGIAKPMSSADIEAIVQAERAKRGWVKTEDEGLEVLSDQDEIKEEAPVVEQAPVATPSKKRELKHKRNDAPAEDVLADFQAQQAQEAKAAAEISKLSPSDEQIIDTMAAQTDYEQRVVKPQQRAMEMLSHMNIGSAQQEVPEAHDLFNVINSQFEKSQATFHKASEDPTAQLNLMSYGVKEKNIAPATKYVYMLAAMRQAEKMNDMSAAADLWDNLNQMNSLLGLQGNAMIQASMMPRQQIRTPSVGKTIERARARRKSTDRMASGGLTGV